MIEFPDEIKVVITDEDIKQGKPGCSYLCPLAVFIKRLYPHMNVMVQPGTMFRGTVRLYHGRTAKDIVYIFPADISKTLLRYDSLGEFGEREFILTKYK